MNKKLIEKIINSLLNVLIFIFSIILLISLYTGIQTKVLKNKYTNFFGYSLFEVETGSMKEAINPGDWIIVKITKSVKLNDIITYEYKGEFVTHRVIEAYNGTFITKGDANNAKDEPVDQNQIVGKVNKILPSFGLFRKTLFNPGVLITLIVTLILFSFAVKKTKKEEDMASLEDQEKFSISGFIINKLELLLNKLKNKKSSKQSHKQEVVVTKVTKDYDDKKIEEELEKTSIYKAIKEDVKEPINEAKEQEAKEDDMDKTFLYRMISVDSTEVNDTLLEIAKNELQDPKQKEVVKVAKEEKTEDNEEALTQIKLDLLKNKKGKNLIDTIFIIKKEALIELTNILLEYNKVLLKETGIRNAFIEAYIDSRYYNHHLNQDENGRILSVKVEKSLKKLKENLINSYEGKNPKYESTVNIYAATYLLINDLEKASYSITDLKVKKEFYKKELIKYFESSNVQDIDELTSLIIKTQKSYDNAIDITLKKLETNMFNLIFNRLTSKKDMYALKLVHNLSFSKVYSDYVIDKTYSEGIIAEDKIPILLTLLDIQLIKDMLGSYFNRKYIIYIPSSLYAKPKKLDKILKMIDDVYAKENIFILSEINTIIKYKKDIETLKKEGFHFASIFNIIKEKDKKCFNLTDFVFVDNKIYSEKEVNSLLPEDIKENIIYEDITDKVKDIGGEE